MNTLQNFHEESPGDPVGPELLLAQGTYKSGSQGSHEAANIEFKHDIMRLDGSSDKIQRVADTTEMIARTVQRVNSALSAFIRSSHSFDKKAIYDALGEFRSSITSYISMWTADLPGSVTSKYELVPQTPVIEGAAADTPVLDEVDTMFQPLYDFMCESSNPNAANIGRSSESGGKSLMVRSNTNSLSGGSKEVGNPTEMASLQVQVWKSIRSVLPDQHPVLGAVCTSIAVHLQRSGRILDALDFAGSALLVSLTKHGLLSAYTAARHYHVAVLYALLDQTPAAKKQAYLALDIYRAARAQGRGANDSACRSFQTNFNGTVANLSLPLAEATCEFLLGGLEQASGRYDLAFALYFNCYQRRLEHLGSDHSETRCAASAVEANRGVGQELFVSTIELQNGLKQLRWAEQPADSPLYHVAVLADHVVRDSSSGSVSRSSLRDLISAAVRLASRKGFVGGAASDSHAAASVTTMANSVPSPSASIPEHTHSILMNRLLLQLIEACSPGVTDVSKLIVTHVLQQQSPVKSNFSVWTSGKANRTVPSPGASPVSTAGASPLVKGSAGKMLALTQALASPLISSTSGTANSLTNNRQLGTSSPDTRSLSMPSPPSGIASQSPESSLVKPNSAFSPPASPTPAVELAAASKSSSPIGSENKVSVPTLRSSMLSSSNSRKSVRIAASEVSTTIAVTISPESGSKSNSSSAMRSAGPGASPALSAALRDEMLTAAQQLQPSGVEGYESQPLPFAMNARVSVIARDSADSVVVVTHLVRAAKAIKEGKLAFALCAPTASSEATSSGSPRRSIKSVSNGRSIKDGSALVECAKSESDTNLRDSVPLLPPPVPTSWPPVPYKSSVKTLSVTDALAFHARGGMVAAAFETGKSVATTEGNDAPRGAFAAAQAAATILKNKFKTIDLPEAIPVGGSLAGTLWAQPPADHVPLGLLFEDVEDEFIKIMKRKSESAKLVRRESLKKALKGGAANSGTGIDSKKAAFSASPLDARRNQNLSIMLSQFGKKTPEDLANAIRQFDAEVLGATVLQTLSENMPTAAEYKAVRVCFDQRATALAAEVMPGSAAGDEHMKQVLAKASKSELYVYHLGAIANLAGKIQGMMGALGAGKSA